ncbi:hypothetical protein BGZ82_004159 [Podila clonocystis]|nr:hypothetical protein BGZ82_004159 [Podila clonocystis]
MASSEYSYRQKFKSKDDTRLASPLRVQHDSDKTYIVIYRNSQREQIEGSSNIVQGSDDHSQRDSQNQAHDEIQPSLKDHFDTCKYLYQHLKTTA